MNNIIFLGGSITEGAGATTKDNSYVCLVENYLKNKFKNVQFYNAGAGGTASQFGVFRTMRDVSVYNPSLVFIEFAVNDRIYSSEDSSVYFEGAIRELLKFNCKIIIIDMPTGMSDACTSIHKKIAYYYDIPVIDVQDHIWGLIGKDKCNWNEISIDNLHPNDLGHKLYADIIINNLEILNIENLKHNLRKKTLIDYEFKNPNIISYERCTFYGHWREESFNLKNKFDLAAVSDTVDDCIIFQFKGKYISMLNLFSRDSGILECVIDDKFNFNLDLYMDTDKYFNTTINVKDIGEGKHTLLLKISKNKNPNSKGNKVVIGGFLVDES